MSNPNTDKYYAPELGERFIATVVDAPSSKAEPYLEVIAPATLLEGYTFEVEVNGSTFTVEVPAGGVSQGQKFSVPFLAGSDGYSAAAIPRTAVPVGHWKDDTCSCCALGCIHPVVWNAYCCPLVLLGQVMTRLRLTWLGNEGTLSQALSTFKIMLGITIFYQAANLLLAFKAPLAVDENGMPVYGSLFVGRYIFGLSFSLFLVILVCKTRTHIRSKYNIPEQSCNGCEDCCCAYWCGCCTIAQMARHTADYETYAGICCSDTGMPHHAPSIV